MATVTATVNNALLGSWSGTLLFEPDRAVKVLDDRIVMGDVVEVAVSSGSMSTTLAQGAYYVRDRAGNSIRFRIVVPSGDDSHDIRSIISSGTSPVPDVTVAGVTSLNGVAGTILLTQIIAWLSDYLFKSYASITALQAETGTPVGTVFIENLGIGIWRPTSTTDDGNVKFIKLTAYATGRYEIVM